MYSDQHLWSNNHDQQECNPKDAKYLVIWLVFWLLFFPKFDLFGDVRWNYQFFFWSFYFFSFWLIRRQSKAIYRSAWELIGISFISSWWKKKEKNIEWHVHIYMHSKQMERTCLKIEFGWHIDYVRYLFLFLSGSFPIDCEIHWIKQLNQQKMLIIRTTWVKEKTN